MGAAEVDQQLVLVAEREGKREVREAWGVGKTTLRARVGGMLGGTGHKACGEAGRWQQRAVGWEYLVKKKHLRLGLGESKGGKGEKNEINKRISTIAGERGQRGQGISVGGGG